MVCYTSVRCRMLAMEAIQKGGFSMLRSALLLVMSVFVAGCATMGGTSHKVFTVAENGVSASRIVVANDAPASTQYAARELQKFLGEITGATIPIVSDNEPVMKGEIIVGANRHFQKLTQGRVDLASLGREGYVLQSTGTYLIIAGGEPRGTLYGVYGLLEDHLGCRWFTPEVSRIPKNANLAISGLDARVIPALEYREPFVKDCFDGDWAARNRMNSSAASLEERHGGKVTYFGFVHTFEGLLPTDIHFDTHPEYYSLIKGQRLKERSQLCCTNKDVIRLVTEEVRKRMKEHPEATVFSVSQNDWYNYCECDACTALAESEGTQMAPVLALVNEVAKMAAREFPDKLVDTLAYQYTRKPPKTMRPEPNVIIRLCSIECCFAHPFETCDSPENKEFVEDVKGWSTRCDRLWVWNYNTSFSNYFVPYPNLRVRDDNILFYARHHVTGIFEQDVYTTLNGELSGLSGYLNAKLLWNPDYDEDTAIQEFLEGVYGPAAAPIRRYIDLLHDKVARENIHMDIWIGADHASLDGGILDEADKLWDEAEALVADSPEILERVKVGRLSVDYAQIERMRTEGLKIYDIDQANGTMVLRPEFAARVQRFFDVAERNGVTAIRESNGELALYKKEFDAYKNASAGAPRRAAVLREPRPGLLYKEYDGVWERLPDFSAEKPIKEGVAQDVSLSVTERREALGLEFTGYLLAPRDGLYILHLRSNDGSRLYLGDDVIVDNDGLHRLEVRSGIVALKKGYHPLRVSYFESGGKEGLELYYEGPGIDKQLVPAAAFAH